MVHEKEDLSRMEGEYGARMIGKLKQMDVLIIGMKGIGVETAKNLILAGPHSVTILDDNLTTLSDLGCNFYMTPQSVGHPRAQQIISHLGELNPNVAVKLHSGSINEQLVKQFDVVVVTDGVESADLATLQHLNEVCRSNHKVQLDGSHSASATAFICCFSAGVAVSVFSDFAAQHLCFDADGTAVKTIIIDHISRAEHGAVTIDGERHLLNDGDFIRIEEVVGMNREESMNDEATTTLEQHFTVNDAITNINAIHEIKLTNNPKRFLIGNTAQLNDYSSGGIATQIKKQLIFKHQSLKQQLQQPQFINGYMDFTKFGRDTQLHLALLARLQFIELHKRLPALHSEIDAQQVVDLAKQIVKNSQMEWLKSVEVDESVMRFTSLYAVTELSPVCALFGGIVAQEITKHTGKYTPITQWLHYDAFELLDEQPSADCQLAESSRYAHQIAIFGKSFQQTLQQQHVFLVGCGALGCEYIKAFAMMGLGVDGEVTMTDDDRIELSNLSRQFLFRRKHVGLAKSISAAQAALAMNPQLTQHLKALEIRVEPKTENVFNDTFWNGLSFVVNALDNQTARNYVDSKCVLHERPLFESGTLGTQANSVVCLPHKTPSYREGAVAGEEQGIAKCTLRNFPSDIVHCIEWSREKFDDLFVSGAELCNSLLEDKEAFFEKLKQDPLTQADALRAVSLWVELAKQPTFEMCVREVYNEFLSLFRNAIKDLTHHFPRDARMKDATTGADLGPFWHGHKRFPSAVERFDPQDPLHVDYFYHGANILAVVFGLTQQSRERVVAIASSLPYEEWKFSGAKVDVEEKKNEEEKTDAVNATVTDEDAQSIHRLTQQLNALDLSLYKRLNPTEFEKDDDSNHHVDWMTAASNLRAWNYQLRPATRSNVRMTAGKIIPAIATTTAAITGFIGIEIYKYIKRVALEKLRAATINLGTNVFCCELLPDPVYRKSGMDQQTYMQVVAIPEKHTIWDKVVLKMNAYTTLQQMMDEFTRVHHQCVIDMLATPSGTVFYNSIEVMQPQRKQIVEQRLQTPVVELYKQLIGPIVPYDRKYIMFDCSVETESGDPGIVPQIQFCFN